MTFEKIIRRTNKYVTLKLGVGGHGRTVVTHSPPTSEVFGSYPGPYVGKLVAYR